MIGIEWEVPASLTTVAGTLNFNVFPGLVLDPNQCSATKDVRAVKDPVPQGDGDILHRRYLTGYTYKFTALIMHDSETPACGSLASEGRQIVEELGLHLRAMLNDDGRYCWLPTGYGDTRALDDTRWFSGVVQTLQNGIWQVEWEIDSPWPYAIDLTQQTISIIGAPNGSAAITNSGNSPFYPVIKVSGYGTGFSIINDTMSQGIVFDATRPGVPVLGGGDYVEISTYKGTLFMNGDGADMSAGVDPIFTNLEDPFTLAPGVNNIEIVGCNAQFLVNNAWQ